MRDGESGRPGGEGDECAEDLPEGDDREGHEESDHGAAGAAAGAAALLLDDDDGLGRPGHGLGR